MIDFVWIWIWHVGFLSSVNDIAFFFLKVVPEKLAEAFV